MLSYTLVRQMRDACHLFLSKRELGAQAQAMSIINDHPVDVVYNEFPLVS